MLRNICLQYVRHSYLVNEFLHRKRGGGTGDGDEEEEEEGEGQRNRPIRSRNRRSQGGVGGGRREEGGGGRRQEGLPLSLSLPSLYGTAVTQPARGGDLYSEIVKDIKGEWTNMKETGGQKGPVGTLKKEYKRLLLQFLKEGQ
ncbi:hypothetical protein EYF80_017200 [Liparis tanakae]|uniref:Uncharacterized protein n=1 Tax=Liparis tanakae TaxID=230148 RepID=A0A4Z2I5T6_9TELE|nr:hypothetical protein EYF80_017200 [Liparis tanakae]